MSRKTLAGIAIWVLTDAALQACPVCFQVEDQTVTSGVRGAVIVLGGITTVVLAGVAVFAARLIRHEVRNRP